MNNAKKHMNTTEQETLGSLQAHWQYQGNISSKDGNNKGQKWQGSNKAKEIKKRWQEYTELYIKKKKKECNDQDNHDIRQINQYNKIETD